MRVDSPDSIFQETRAVQAKSGSQIPIAPHKSVRRVLLQHMSFNPNGNEIGVVSDREL